MLKKPEPHNTYKVRDELWVAGANWKYQGVQCTGAYFKNQGVQVHTLTTE